MVRLWDTPPKAAVSSASSETMMRRCDNERRWWDKGAEAEAKIWWCWMLWAKKDILGGWIWWIDILGGWIWWIGLSFNMILFNSTHSSPFSIGPWVTSGCTYSYLISHCSYLSFLEILPLEKLSVFIKWMEHSFCNQKESVLWRIFKIFVPKWARSWSASDPSMRRWDDRDDDERGWWDDETMMMMRRLIVSASSLTMMMPIIYIHVYTYMTSERMRWWWASHTYMYTHIMMMSSSHHRQVSQPSLACPSLSNVFFVITEYMNRSHLELWSRCGMFLNGTEHRNSFDRVPASIFIS